MSIRLLTEYHLPVGWMLSTIHSSRTQYERTNGILVSCFFRTAIFNTLRAFAVAFWCYQDTGEYISWHGLCYILLGGWEGALCYEPPVGGYVCLNFQNSLDLPLPLSGNPHRVFYFFRVWNWYNPLGTSWFCILITEAWLHMQNGWNSYCCYFFIVVSNEQCMKMIIFYYYCNLFFFMNLLLLGFLTFRIQNTC